MSDQPQPSAAPKVNPLRRSAEQFDLNTADIRGEVFGLWSRGEDIFARVSLDERNSMFATVRFPRGGAGGQPVPLQSGMKVRVRGYLSHNEYRESLTHFLENAKASSLIDLAHPDDRRAWLSVSFLRRNTILNAQAVQLFGDGAPIEIGKFDPSSLVDTASVEGIVSRVWEYPRSGAVDVFARLAVYDDQTRVVEKYGRDEQGRSFRSPHYVTVCAYDGKVSGFPVKLETKQRIRVIGPLRDRGSLVNLREELLRTGNPAVMEMLQRVRDVDRFGEAATLQQTLHIAAQAVVIYSHSGGSRRANSS